MLRYGIALAATMISTSAFAQDSHSIDLQVESSSSVAVSGSVSFAWNAPLPGQPYSTSPDGLNSTSVTLDYTSDGASGGIEATSDTDFETSWGISVTVDSTSATCGFGNSLVNLGAGSNQIISFSGGTCSESASLEYSAEISNPSIFSAMNSGAIATITYTMF